MTKLKIVLGSIGLLALVGVSMGQISGGSCGTANIPCYVTIGGLSTLSSNITQWASVVLGAPSTYGTSPGSVMVPGVNAFVTNATSDPCTTLAKISVSISQAANAKLFSQVAAKKNYICSFMVVGADAENVSLVEGTGSTCGTSTAAIIGGATAANGPNLPANGGFVIGSGSATVAAGANNNFDVCLFQSGSGRVAGVLTYVQQ